ncbi:MAG: ATP-binding cassette domain-containing protein [Gemmatimonadota bacterium]|nr:ATP-binding cassette domain-containing protein [Gemmatimonadota bacterium]MDE2985315.1 ATP-binding cassette domain-containing protein [Gemmatimonadota bacterium]
MSTRRGTRGEHGGGESPASAARLRDVTRRFGPVTALEGVSFDLVPGEIHGLLGENGAGKTTLARILGGLLPPDEGRVEIGGRAVDLGSAREARALGVAMVHQHFSLVPRFTGFQNIALFNGEAWTAKGTAAPEYRDRVEARAAELKLEVELDVAVEALGVGARQRIEILKALMSETGVLLLDEPTAVLAPREVDGLFAVLREVAAAGTGIVLVAHKLDEVLAAADRVTVLRRGRWVMTEAAEAVSAGELAEAMVGGVVGDGMPEDRPAMDADPPAPDGDARSLVASLERVTTTRDGQPTLRDVTVEVRRGEVLGIAGVDGNGQRELARVLAGIRAPDAGDAVLPAEVGWIPQDRGHEGLVSDFTISENIAFALHGKDTFRTGPWLDWDEIEETAAELVRDMDVRATSPAATAATLSGGNQQKVVTGREFLRSGDLLVAESPTRGLDVKATVAVRSRIATLARDGDQPPGVVLISADLDEILELSDRIAVMARGRLIPVPRDAHNPRDIGELMLGAREGEPS